MIGLVFDVDDTLYEQIVPFENAFRSLFDIDIDMEKFYLLSRYYSDVKFEASRNGEMTGSYLSNPRSGKRFRCIPNR